MAMGTMGMTRKAKRKLERQEKKSNKNKRQRGHIEKKDTDVPLKHAQNPAFTHKKRSQTNRKNGGGGVAPAFQNKFHELIEETTGVSMTGNRKKVLLSVEDQQIKALETKLGLSSASGKASGMKKLQKEFAQDGLGEDFTDFLSGLDNISKMVKEQTKAAHTEESDEEEHSDDQLSDDEGFDSDMEMDEATRREMELLQAEDADFLQGMDELPTDESEVESETDLTAFDTEDEDDSDEDDDEVEDNTLKNLQLAASHVDSAAEVMKKKTKKVARFAEDIKDDSENDPVSEESEAEEEGEEGEEGEDYNEQSGDEHDNEESEEEEPAAPVVVEEDIYGRPLIKTAEGSKAPSAYLPPHLRRKLEAEAVTKTAGSASGTAALPSKLDDQALRDLTRRLNGQLNRISESNMESISLELEKIYRENGRSIVNQILLEKILQMTVHPRQVMTPLIKVCGALIAALYHSVGSEIGGFFIEKIVLKLVEGVKQSANDEDKHGGGDVDGEDNDARTSKEPVNLMLFISMLYNFGVVHCTLVYGLFRSFVDNFSSTEIELIHTLLKACGPQLRSDDADALREMVVAVQQKVAAAENTNSDQPAERIRFILDLIYDLKKPSKQKKSRQGGRAGGTENDLSSLKKWLGRVKTRCGNANNPLRVSLHELLHAEQDGRWWIVGGTWVGYQQQKKSGRDEHEDAGNNEKRDEENRLLKLAEKQRMNTDVRKKIFVAIMGAADCFDAYERLLQLCLKEKQEREIVRVVLHCCSQEKKFNKYYLVLAEKLCEMDQRYKFTFQLAFWDVFKQLDTFKPRKLYNLAQMLAGLIIGKSLSLSCLKVFDFTQLEQQSVLFLRILLEKILKLESELEMAQVFQRLLQTKKAQLTIDGLAVFMHQHLMSFRTEEDPQTRMLLKKRSKSAKSLLDQLAKSAASSKDMEGFM